MVDLLRCGPAYRANGSLDVAAQPGAGVNLLAPVGRRLLFELLTNADAGRSVHYRLNVFTPAGQLAMPGAKMTTARSRVAVITAPP